MNKKINGKLGLSKETLRKLDDLNLKKAAGGEPTDGTNICTECTACASCIDTYCGGC
ncbi:MAG TPA: class I lanthipeptide [Thermoanaerobaculia bacterium]|nr:class I lanthipeptide [Thermoanaerobaculia bacterium]